MTLINTLSRYLHPQSSVSFWHTKIGPRFYDYRSLEDYYIDLSAKTDYSGPTDQDGIIMLDYQGEIGLQYNPCAVSQLALGHFQKWKSGDSASRDSFLKLASWLRDSHKDGRWEYLFDLDAYEVKAPWTSALAQAQAVSVLVRAEREQHGEGFIEAAQAGMKHTLLPVQEGGLLWRSSDGVFLEEVVADRITGILDGFIFAVFGLFDYWFQTGDEEVKAVLDETVETIKTTLPEYDMGFWSRADLYWEKPKMIASPFYHGLHVAQLKVLSDLTGVALFEEYGMRWEGVAKSIWNRARAVLLKIWFKLTCY